MNTEFTTPGGVILPLMSLKGKPYLQVAHRIVWLAEQEPAYEIRTEFLTLTEECSVCKATVVLWGPEGAVKKQASATKQENRGHFADFVEKSETGAIGRALALLGFGTQFAIADLDEGERIVDSPVTPAVKAAPPAATPAKAPSKKAEVKTGVGGFKNKQELVIARAQVAVAKKVATKESILAYMNTSPTPKATPYESITDAVEGTTESDIDLFLTYLGKLIDG